MAIDQSKERPLILLRWALITSLAYMILLSEKGASPSSVDLAYVALLLASNLVIPRLPYRNPQTLGALLMSIDTVFVLVGLMLCDTTSQDLLIGYFMCIVMANFGNSEKGVAGAAILVTGAYTAWIFRNWEDVSRPFILIRLPFLFITTVFYGYMMQRVRGEHAGRMRAEARVHGLDCLLQVTRSFSASLATGDVLERVAEAIKRALGVDRCEIQLIADRPVGSPSDFAFAQAIERREPVLLSEARGEQRSRSILALPIVYDVEPLGVLLIEAERKGRSFDPDEVEFCQVIANAAAAALKNARQYETLVEVERAKSEFLANLSHELRTPLSAILGYAELAADRAAAATGPEHDLGRLVTGISRSASDMKQHVESLLRLSQLTLGRERKQVMRVDLPRLLGQTLEGVKRLARQGELSFELDVAPDVDEIYTDGEKLKRIIQYILMNAVKFTERGSIRISAAVIRAGGDAASAPLPNGVQPWEKLLTLSIEDTGIGIDEGDLEKIFYDFRQIDGSATRRYPGLGVGLAVCRRLAEVLGGAIRVRSRPGEGSIFEVVLPVQTSPHPA